MNLSIFHRARGLFFYKFTLFDRNSKEAKNVSLKSCNFYLNVPTAIINRKTPTKRKDIKIYSFPN